ncbi:hypothetical protein ACFVWX_29110 [Streptomyces sp. NPDC058220]
MTGTWPLVAVLIVAAITVACFTVGVIADHRIPLPARYRTPRRGGR